MSPLTRSKCARVLGLSLSPTDFIFLYTLFRVSQKTKSVDCLSAHLSIFFWREKSTDLKSVHMCRHLSRFDFFQQVVGLVQKFYVGSPIGDLNPFSSLSIKNPTSIFNWPDNWQHRDHDEDTFEMMVRRCGGCVPACLFLGAKELKSRKKKNRQTSRQI
jgi:hypothetical protein